MENGTALATIPQVSASTALEPVTIDQALWLATQLVKSGVLGRAVQKPEAAFAVILAGRELGLTAMQSLRSCHVIEGKVAMSSDLIAALVKRSPLCKSFRLIESTAKVATYEAEREGEGKTRMSFTMEEAQAAGLTNKDNWKKYPAAMLRARCIAALARVVFPDLLLGVYENDELAPAPVAAAMPVLREVPAANERPPAPAEPAIEAVIAENIVDYWKRRLLDAESEGMEAVEGVRSACKAEVTTREDLLAIGVTYAEIKKRLAS